MLPIRKQKNEGFTLIELLVVIAIIGVLASIVFMAVGQARSKGNDASYKSQSLELLKALEFYYTNNGYYPLQGGSSGVGGALSGIDATFYGTNRPIRSLPADAATRYYYCVSSNQRSMLLAVDTEQDEGGSNYCSITRGAASFGCDVWLAANASSSCLNRFP